MSQKSQIEVLLFACFELEIERNFENKGCSMGNRYKILSVLILFCGIGIAGRAQMAAMDFNRMDCNGNGHHLFADLDAGNAVILEFFMLNCTPCITAGNKLETMKASILAQYPGKVKGYAIGFDDGYLCTDISNWVSSHGFTSIPMDSGATQLANYGGFGMPTIVILGGGTQHSILGTPYIGFSTSDTITMAADIRNFLSGATAVAAPKATEKLEIFPSPSQHLAQVRMTLQTAGLLNLTVTDLSGRAIATVMNETVASGLVQRSLDTAALPNGYYFLTANINGQSTTQKFVVAH
jgi:hypothetical protein